MISFACSSKVDKSVSRNCELNLTLKSGKKFYVKDSTQYSTEFINELKSIDNEFEFVKMIGNKLILSKTDTYEIPTDIPLNKDIIYKAEKHDTLYKLLLHRINYTNISYVFSVNKKQIKTGQVVLQASLFFGAETMEITPEETIMLSQYFDNKENSICIKIESGSAKRVTFSLIDEKDSTKNYDKVPILIKK